MGKTVKLFGFVSVQSPATVKKFVEGHNGEGTVCDVVEVGKFEGARAHAIVEFATIEAAEHIKSLAAAADGLWFKKSYPKAWDMEPNSRISHSQHKIDNLEVSYESIWKIKLGCPRGQTAKFLIIQLYGAPRIYENDGQWIREVDFTPSSSIGQSTALCLRLPGRDVVPKIRKDFFYYEEGEEEFILERGSSFSCNSYLVPNIDPPQDIVLPFKILFKINLLVHHGCLPGPLVDDLFFRFVAPSRFNTVEIEYVLEKVFHLRECCYDPINWLTEQYIKYYKSRTLPELPQIALEYGLVYVAKDSDNPN
ncbi:hypothetical protein Dsin_011822 [Dipteronia sinensis]|uniref:RNA-directed RNA polymerase n=1 Tax=Dipteronia sinensis TaxID=43782 RepID=A0AAE0E7W7_9ROSI|nr:hypothetical protein Dsin_011822 [Dipteronia sinensis]